MTNDPPPLSCSEGGEGMRNLFSVLYSLFFALSSVLCPLSSVLCPPITLLLHHSITPLRVSAWRGRDLRPVVGGYLR